MNKNEVISRIKSHEPALRQAGLGSLYLFGSVASDRAHDGSDVDLFFDLDRAQGFTLFDLVDLQEKLEEIVGTKVDLMSRNGIHPRKKDRIIQSAYQIF